MARKPTRKSKLPFDPSEPAMPLGFGPEHDDAIDLATTPGVMVNERAAAAPSLSDLQVPIPQPRQDAGDDILFDEEIDDPPTSEADRAALAKQLAQEALARARSEEKAVQLDDDDAVDLDDDDGVDLDDDDDGGVDLDDDEPEPEPEPPKAPKKKMSLAERARRPKSAAEVIQEAKAKPSAKAKAKPAAAPKPAAPAKTAKAATKKASKKKKKATPAKAKAKATPPPVEFEETSELMAQADQEMAVVRRAPVELDATVETRAQPETPAELEPTAQMKPPPPPPTPARDPRPALAVLGSVKVQRTWSVDQRPIFAAMWTAHRAHAQASGKLALAAMASVLIDAADRIAEGQLIALEANINGEDYAVWVDADRGVVLGVASPPAVWLVGL